MFEEFAKRQNGESESLGSASASWRLHLEGGTIASILSLDVGNRLETDKTTSLKIGDPLLQVGDRHLEGGTVASISRLKVGAQENSHKLAAETHIDPKTSIEWNVQRASYARNDGNDDTSETDSSDADVDNDTEVDTGEPKLRPINKLPEQTPLSGKVYSLHKGSA